MFKQIALAALALASVSANAHPTQTLVSKIFADKKIAKGHVLVDLSRREITLHTTGTIPCSPDGTVCAAVMPAVTNVQLEIKSESTDRCGVRTFVASENLMPVDGPFQEIRVIDYTQSVCNGRPMAPTVITYTHEIHSRMQPRKSRSVQTFRGSQLRPLALH